MLLGDLKTNLKGMVLEVGVGSGTEKEDSGSPLEQHERLLRRMAELEEAMQRGLSQEGEFERDGLNRLIDRVVAELEVHFEAERRSVQHDFDDAPELRARFEELDREHPTLLLRFVGARNALSEHLDLQEVALLLRQAISAFFEHEAQEDVLFTSDA